MNEDDLLLILIAGSGALGGPSFNGNAYSSYSLLDTFTDTRAAGSVNGTLPVVGGARFVTDTNGRLSINGTKLVTAAGAAVASNFYPSETRVLGKVILATINDAGDNNGMRFEYGSTASYIKWISNLRIRDAGLNEIIVTGNVAAADTPMALGLRTAGQYYAAYLSGQWTLLWIANGDNSSRTPGITFQVNNVGTADSFRITGSTYIWPALAYDTFTRSDGALGTSETVGPDGATQVVTARTWTGATWTISTNKAINTPNLGSEAITNGGFDADTDWDKGAGIAIAAGVAAFTASGGDLTASVAPLTVGTWYSVTYTVGGFAAGTVNAKLGSTAFPTHAADGTYTETGLALTTAFAFTGAGFTGTLDNVSVKPLTLSELFATFPLSTPDVLVNLACTLVGATDGKQVGIVTNLNSAASPTDFRLTLLDGRGNMVVYDCITGTYTVKNTTAITYSAGKLLQVILAGVQLRQYYNLIDGPGLQTMGANTNLLCGLFSTSPLSSLDNIFVMPRGTSNELSGLNSL